VDTRAITRTTTARPAMTEVAEVDAVDEVVVAEVEEEGTKAIGRITTPMTTARGEKDIGRRRYVL
jgi:hypothetical protein